MTEVLEKLAELDGLITEDVGRALYEYARDVPNNLTVVEIGAWKGKSTCYLAAGRAIGLGGEVYSVDSWSTDVQGWSRYHRSASYDQWHDQVQKTGYLNMVTGIQGKSVDVARTWPTSRPIGLLYIDGDHSRKAVFADYRAWRPYLAPGALVIFDDYGVSHNPGVAPAVHDLVKRKELPSISVVANGRLAVAVMDA